MAKATHKFQSIIVHLEYNSPITSLSLWYYNFEWAHWYEDVQAVQGKAGLTLSEESCWKYKKIYYSSKWGVLDPSLPHGGVAIPSLFPVDINNELAKVTDWLAVNELSLYVRKTKYVIFHAINKRIEGVIPNLEINGIPLERVQNFNFLGLVSNENMSWKLHIDLLANKLAKCAGVLNKSKRFLPIHILRTLYFSMVQSRLVHCILTWGFDYYRMEKLQKRFARLISSNEYNAHSEPLFKVLDILKIERLFSQSCLKCAYKFKKSPLPKYFIPPMCT